MHLIIPNLLTQINKYFLVPKWKIIKCIDKTQLKDDYLCSNVNAIKHIKKFINSFYIIKNMNKINKVYTTDLYNFIDWNAIAQNKNAIKYLKREIKIAKLEKRNPYFNYILYNKIPSNNTIKLLKREIVKSCNNINLCKIDWYGISKNPDAIDIINYEIKLAKLENRDHRLNHYALLSNENYNYIEDNKNVIEDNKNAIEYNKNVIEDNKNVIEYNKNYDYSLDEIDYLLCNSNPKILKVLSNKYKIEWICKYGTKFYISNIINRNKILCNYSSLSCNKNIFEVDKSNYKNILLLLSEMSI